MATSFKKGAISVLDFVWDWTPWLGGDTIIGEPLVTVPEGLTLVSHTHTPTTVTAFLSGGADSETYTVACKIVTTGGRTEEKSIMITIDNG